MCVIEPATEICIPLLVTRGHDVRVMASVDGVPGAFNVNSLDKRGNNLKFKF